MGIFQGQILGTIKSKIVAEGTMSQGPIYYLVPVDKSSKYDEIFIQKNVNLWETDEFLAQFLDKTVLIVGEITETKDTITIECMQINENGHIFNRPPPQKSNELSPDELSERLKKLDF